MLRPAIIHSNKCCLRERSASNHRQRQHRVQQLTMGCPELISALQLCEAASRIHFELRS